MGESEALLAVLHATKDALPCFEVDHSIAVRILAIVNVLRLNK
jgi:hypothetical protein